MNLMDLFRPAWKRSDAKQRLQAVLETDDQEVLAEVAKHDPIHAIRSQAVKRLSDDKVLYQIVRYDHDPDIRRRACAHLKDLDLIERLVMDTKLPAEFRELALSQSTDRELIERIALRDKDQGLRYVAVEHCNNRGVLRLMVKQEVVPRIKELAMRKLKAKGTPTG